MLVARVLAQESQLLVLDEPTNHLDIKAQLELLALIRELGTSTITALHDLNVAAAHCDRLYVLNRGEIAAHGTVVDVLTPQLLQDVFGVRAHCELHPVTAAFTWPTSHSGTVPMSSSLTDLELVPQTVPAARRREFGQ